MSAFERLNFSPITREQITKYSEPSGDFNRIHLDENFAKSAGLPSVIAHGMLSMGLAATALARWGVDRRKVKSFQARFKEKVFPGDRLAAEFLSQEERGSTRILKWHLINQAGVEIISAEAEILP